MSLGGEMADLCARLAALPPGAVVGWQEATASADRPFAVDWAAVQAAALQHDDDRLNRLWLVVPTGAALGEHHPPDLTIAAEPDLDVHAVFDPDARRDVIVRTVRRGGALSAEDEAALRSTALRLGVEVSVSPGWSAELVSDLVRRWIEARCGRTDVVVEFDPKAGALDAAPASVRELGFDDMAQLAAVVRVGRGSVEVGLEAMRYRDRSAAAQRLLAASADSGQLPL